MVRGVRTRNHIPQAIGALVSAETIMLERLGSQIVEQIDEGFEQGRDALGRPWAPLAERTIREKGRSDILIETGEMRESIQYDVDRARGRLEIQSDSAVLPYHEYGIPERNLPKRPVMEPASIWANQRLRPITFSIVGSAVERTTF